MNWGCQLERVHAVTWASSDYGGAVPRSGIPREQGEVSSTRDALDLEVTQHYFAAETSLPIFKEGAHKPAPAPRMAEVSSHRGRRAVGLRDTIMVSSLGNYNQPHSRLTSSGLH